MSVQPDAAPCPLRRAGQIALVAQPGGHLGQQICGRLSPKRTATFLTWGCLGGSLGACEGGDRWVRIGANRDVNGNPGAFDAYLKRHIKRQVVADYIAVVLERACLRLTQ